MTYHQIAVLQTLCAFVFLYIDLASDSRGGEITEKLHLSNGMSNLPQLKNQSMEEKIMVSESQKVCTF